MTVNAPVPCPSMSTTPSWPTATVRPHQSCPPATLSLRFEVAALLLVDALVAAVAALCGLDARFGGVAGSIAHTSYGRIAAGFPVLWVGAMAAAQAYDGRFLAAGSEEYRRVLNGAVWLGAGVAITSFILHLDLSRGFVAVTMPLALLLTLGCRYVVRKGLHLQLANGAAIHRLMVIGSRSSVERLARHMARIPSAGYAVVGTSEIVRFGNAVDSPALERHAKAAIAGVLEDARALSADTIAVVSGDALGDAGIRRLSWELEGTGIKLLVAPTVVDVAGPRIVVRPVAGLPVLHIAEPEFHGAQRVLKECIDRLGSAALLLLASPLLAAIALALLLTQGRPILYRQERVGRHGRHFQIHKFRTMRHGADRLQHLIQVNTEGGGLAKTACDPRVTPLGRLLRKYSLDELPQLWDVLTGSMSLVGPRPQQPCEVERYAEEARRRLLVKPGITGLWQVSGRSDLSWEEWLRLDLHYVENWSVGMDMMLLLRTASAVMNPHGAY